MHIFKTVAEIRIAPDGAAKLDRLVEGLCTNKRVAIFTNKGVRGLGLMNNAREMTREAVVKIYETTL